MAYTLFLRFREAQTLNLTQTIPIMAFLKLLLVIISSLTPILGLGLETNNSSFTYTSIQPHLITCRSSFKPLTPKTLARIQSIIRQAIEEKITVKALGSRCSITDIICTDGIPIYMERVKHFRLDSSTGIVTAGAGIRLHELLRKLHNNGRTIFGIPAYSDITVGGVLGTGSHGSGRLTEPGTIADSLESLKVVDGMGKIRRISGEELRPFKANLGLLGIIYEVRIRTVPQHKIEIRHFTSSDDILFKIDKNPSTIMKYVGTSDRFQFWWFPTSKKVVLSVGKRMAPDKVGACETHFLPEVSREAVGGFVKAFETTQEGHDHLGMLFNQYMTRLSLVMKVPGRSPVFSGTDDSTKQCRTNPPMGYNHKMVTNRCEVCLWDHNVTLTIAESSVAIPITELGKALKSIKGILNQYPVELPLSGIFVRFLARSDGFLMANEGRETAVIDWVLVTRKNRFEVGMMGLAGSQAMIQTLIKSHKGRPLWSKNGLYYSSRHIIQKAYPEFPKFLKKMDEFDPNGVFLNDFGRRLRFGLKRTSIDDKVKHCALVDNCICEKDSDCGADLVCGKLKEFRVCRENERSRKYNHETYKGRVTRNFINYFKQKYNYLQSLFKFLTFHKI